MVPARKPATLWRDRPYVHPDACARPRADRGGPPPLQEAPGAEWAEEGAAQARVLRKAVRAAPPGRTPQTARDPQGRRRPPDLTPADSQPARHRGTRRRTP